MSGWEINIKMNNSIIYAILCAFSFASWTVFHAAASKYVNSVLGAILVSTSAILCGVFFWLTNKSEASFEITTKGFFFIFISGASSFCIDYLALKAYGLGLPITIGGPIIIGGSMGIACLIGFLMGEDVSLTKISAIVLIAIGASILATQQRI